MSNLDPALRRQGFTLVEVVVALVIFGLAFAVLARIVQTGILQSGRAEAMTTATLLARSQLARIGADLPIAEGELEGDAGGGFGWRIVIRPATSRSTDQTDPAKRSPILPYQVEVTITWGKGGPAETLTLTSLRLAAAEPSPMSASTAPAERGFTLLEILVAVTLLGLLMAALFGGVRLGVRAWEASETRLDDDARLTAVQDFLRARLTEAYPSATSVAGAETAPAFRGEPDRLSFVTLMPEHLGAGIDRMLLALTATSGGSDLSVEWWPAELGDDPAAASDVLHDRVLLAHVAELHLAYFGPRAPDQPPAWSEVWSQPCCRFWSACSCASRTRTAGTGRT